MEMTNYKSHIHNVYPLLYKQAKQLDKYVWYVYQLVFKPGVRWMQPACIWFLRIVSVWMSVCMCVFVSAQIKNQWHDVENAVGGIGGLLLHVEKLMLVVQMDREWHKLIWRSSSDRQIKFYSQCLLALQYSYCSEIQY